MPDYFFNARDQQGKAVSGQRKAINAEEVANQLINEGLIPVDISAGSIKKAIATTPTKKDWFSPRVTSDDLHIFCRQMYAMIHAGIPVSAALIQVSQTTRNKTLSQTLQKIVMTLNKGSSLNVAMAQFPKIFSEFFVNLIVIGENTGNLDNIFMHLAEYLEMEVDIVKKIKSALRYPIIVIISIVIALIVINIFVIPAFAKLYKSMNGVLPLPTRILFQVSEFMIDYWYLLIAACLILIFAIRSYLRTPKGALRWGKLQLKIPIVGWLIHRILLTRFARLLSLVLRAGITAVDGIQMVGASTNNAYMSQQIKGVTELVAKGNTISAAIDKTNLFPPLVIQMILLGEESGTIDQLLDEVAEYYQRETTYDFARLNDLIEPILIVVLAGMVLILALGIYLPIWNLATLANKQ